MKPGIRKTLVFLLHRSISDSNERDTNIKVTPYQSRFGGILWNLLPKPRWGDLKEPGVKAVLEDLRQMSHMTVY